MSLLQQSRKAFTALILVLILTLTTACGGATNVSQAERTTTRPAIGRDATYSQLQRGNTPGGQNFGNWVVQTSRGLITDAFVRDNNKLGVVISPQVPPSDVRPLARSLVEGFRRNFPNQDLTVYVYAPDKQLILTAQYDTQTSQIQYT